MRFAAVALLLLGLCAAAATDATAPHGGGASDVMTTLAVDRQLADTSLPELLARPLHAASSPLDAQLQLASLKCREFGVLASTHSAPASGDASNAIARGSSPTLLDYCRKVRYVRLTRKKLHETLQAELARADDEEHEHLEAQQQAEEQAEEPPSAPATQEIERRAASSVDLQEFFESFAETARPVVLNSGGTKAEASAVSTRLSDDHPLLGFASGDEWTQFLAACFVHTTAAERVTPLRVRDDACAVHLERFRVPLYVVHDYLRRTDASLADAFLPSLVRVEPSLATSPSADAVLSCPLGLHMLALVLPSASDGASLPSVDVETFDQRLKPFLLAKGGSRAQVAEVALSAASADIVDPQSARHSGLPRIAPLHSTRSVAPGSFVFVPGSQFAVARPPAAAADDDTQAEALAMLRFCFVDASNFNAVKQEVALEALVDAEALALLQSLQSHAFDRSMFRRPQPKDMLWSSFVAWPKETKLLKKSELEGGELQLSRRERLKQWQDDKRWDRRVEGLTLPVSLPPVVVNTTRTTATLRFQDLYDTPKHDITAYGYVVRWRNIDEEVALAAARRDRNAAGSPADRRDTLGADAESASRANQVNVTREHLVRSSLPTTLFGDDFDGKDIEVVVRGLLAETRYAFSVQIYVDDTCGLESESSLIAQTAPCSEPSGVRGAPTASDSDGACTTLRWLDPADDGGKPVRVYLISARVVERGFDPAVTAVVALAGGHDGSRTAVDEKVFALNAEHVASPLKAKKWRSAAVCALVPGATYLFRVAAMNAIGAGPWSSTSDPTALPPSSSRHAGTTATSRRSDGAGTEIPTLKGRGDPDYVPMRAFSMRELVDLITKHGPEVLIATVAEDAEWEHQQHRQLSSSSSSSSRISTPTVVLSDVQERLVVAADPTVASATDAEPLVFDVWTAHFSPRAFHVSAEIVRADPLDASAPLRNAAQAKDRVVLVARGGTPFVFKTHYAQLAGALGVVIADVNDTCRGRFDQSCVPGGDRLRGEGFAAQDRHALWSQNRIPCVLLLHADAHKLLDLVGAA